jgi:beta-lactamase superfamily II metal-dependent hydrolase
MAGMDRQSKEAFYNDALARKVTRLVLVLIISALAMLLLAPQSRAGVSTVNASLMNVGQGDSILLRDGNGFDVLIDGGDTDAGPKVVAYLRAQGVDDIP